jgi:hypothetical protein
MSSIVLRDFESNPLFNLAIFLTSLSINLKYFKQNIGIFSSKYWIYIDIFLFQIKKYHKSVVSGKKKRSHE